MGLAKQIKTNRTVLRLITEADYAAIFTLESLPEVDRYNTLGIAQSIEDTIRANEPLVKANQNNTGYTFAVCEKATEKFMGLFAIKMLPSKYQAAEVWYKYLPEFWGKGLATEVLSEMIRICFKELKLHRVEAGCAVDNIGSIKVLEKAGMQREGRKRATLPLVSGWSDNYEYGILSSEFLTNN